MTISFDVPNRYDQKLADEGVWFNIVENGKKFGRFRCRYLDVYNPRTEVELSRIRHKYKVTGELDLMDETDQVRVTFCEAMLLDWQGVTAGGKPVPFSVENAKAYFNQTSTRHVFAKLVNLSHDVTNYAEDETVLDVEAVEKN